MISRRIDTRSTHVDLHWVDGPKDEGETADCGEEGGGLVVLLHGGCTAIEGELVDNNQVGDASHGVPAPLGSLVNRESSEETSKDHDDISNDGDEDASAVQTGQEAKIEQQEWGGETPVNITSPVDLSVDDVIGVWEVLLGVLDGNLILANAITDSHGIVGEGGKGGNEGS